MIYIAFRRYTHLNSFCMHLGEGDGFGMNVVQRNGGKCTKFAELGTGSRK